MSIDLTDPVIAAHLADLPVTTITSPDGATTHLVPVQDYLALEDECDGYRRACALINGWRTGQRDFTELARILAGVGMDLAQARAVAEIVAQVRDGSLMRSTTTTGE